ncbi:JmjC domain-containing protein 1 [Diplonema papillatum]|nr:JmjC domain-containing protein 1 [Diplonema papillatum]
MLRRKKPNESDSESGDAGSEHPQPAWKVLEKEQSKPRSWTAYIGTLLTGALVAVFWATVVGQHGPGMPSGPKLASDQCKLFLSSGPYSSTSKLISSAMNTGCSVFLGDPWSENSALRTLLHDVLPAAESFASLSEAQVLERDAWRALSAASFTDKYAKPLEVVVLRQGGELMLPSRWNSSFFAAECGSVVVSPTRYNKSAAAWAGMEEHSIGSLTLSEFIDKLWAGNASDAYVHDTPLIPSCPHVLASLTIPRFFTNDYIQSVAHETRYRDEWPSLFIGSPKAQTGLHLDNLGSHAWLLQLEGSKHWRFVGPGHEALVYSTPYSFDLDLFDTDFATHRLASLLDVTEIITKPGDIIFVPGTVYHQVRNLNNSVSISSNYIDATCLESALKSIDEAGTADESVYLFGKTLKKHRDRGELPPYPAERDQPWAEFKAQRVVPNDVFLVAGEQGHEHLIFLAVGATAIFLGLSGWILWEDLAPGA